MMFAVLALFCTCLSGCFISTSDMWSDFGIEGFWMEAIVEQRINKLLKTVEQAISAIQMLRNSVQ